MSNYNRFNLPADYNGRRFGNSHRACHSSGGGAVQQEFAVTLAETRKYILNVCICQTEIQPWFSQRSA